MKKTKGPKREGIYLFSLFPVSFVIMLYGYIGTYNRLLGDSLCSYYYAHRLGLFRSIWYWRITWSGRYSAYGFDWLVSNIFSPKFIPWFIPIFLFLWVLISTLTAYYFLYSAGSNSGNIIQVTCLGLYAVFLIIVTMPSIEQSFFWVDGFRAYTFPIIALTTYGFLYYIFIDRIHTKTHMLFAATASFSLFFLSGGLSETIAAVQVVALVYMLVYSWVTGEGPRVKKTYPLLWSGLLGAIVALTVVITAPGNLVRQSFFPPHPDLLKLMSISLNGYLDFLNTLTSAKYLTSILSGVLLSIWAGTSYEGTIRLHGRKILLQITGALLISFSCFPPGVYGYSEPPPDRVLSIAVLFICIPLMFAGFFTGYRLRNLISSSHYLEKSILIITAMLILTSSWLNFSNLYIAKDKYIEYASVWDETDLIIKNAKLNGQASVVVKPDPSWAGLDVLNDNPNHWVNECYSYFYGIQVFGKQ